MRVALVHDWLTGMRGGEAVLEALVEEFPDSEIFTLVHLEGTVSPTIEARPIHSSFLNHAPFVREHYRKYLPLFPAAIETLRPRGFDVVISSSHCVAKGVRANGTHHICYSHTPVRYAWDQFDEYFPNRNLLRPVARAGAAALRAWDRATVSRVNTFVANSSAVRDRIQRNYHRDASVIHPPVDVDRFTRPRAPDDFYLVAGALVPYKRIDRAIEACEIAGRRLLVVGRGPERARLERMGARHTVFLGHVSEEELADLYSRCRAVIMPGVEDFGIVTIEAQAAGAPVIALAAGGSLDTVTADTGILVEQPTAQAFADAILELEGRTFDEQCARRHAAGFSRERFRESMRVTVLQALS